jgi:histidine triad (HIT) family protein
MPDKDYCIFCEIVKGKLPCYKIYEDPHFLAFLDTRPLNPGHTLVIPKQHIKWVWDVPDIDKYFKVSQKVANAIRNVEGTEKIVSIIFGETIQHAHISLLPKIEGDKHPFGWIDIKNVKKMTDKEMETISIQIREEVKKLK